MTRPGWWRWFTPEAAPMPDLKGNAAPAKKATTGAYTPAGV